MSNNFGNPLLSGVELKMLRKFDLKMTQEELGKVLGVSKPTIARYESMADGQLPRLFSWAFAGAVYHKRAKARDEAKIRKLMGESHG